MATARHIKQPETRAVASKTPAPPSKRVRVKLVTVDDVRGELARIYKDARAGTREVGDVSRLANVLFILSRLIEGADLEARLTKLEASAETNTRKGRR